jgi:hypothetical protein
VARKGAPHEQQRLKESLHFLRTADEGRYVGTANFFEAVLENPAAFPKPLNREEFLNPIEAQSARFAWESQVLQAAQEQLAKKPGEASKEGMERDDGDITPKHFRFDKKLPVEPDIPLKLCLPVLPLFSDNCLEKKMLS